MKNYLRIRGSRIKRWAITPAAIALLTIPSLASAEEGFNLNAEIHHGIVHNQTDDSTFGLGFFSNYSWEHIAIGPYLNINACENITQYNYGLRLDLIVKRFSLYGCGGGSTCLVNEESDEETFYKKRAFSAHSYGFGIAKEFNLNDMTLRLFLEKQYNDFLPIEHRTLEVQPSEYNHITKVGIEISISLK